ncbi:MAG TPA: NAD(P)H-dependent glycerol-3-phosphate dehydrogenase, partial [Deinococcales bacterium]|nr:NAD(P)H-dependent glycerol-3-phosphate dehydrogenase [Deinococcales bacterium]
LEEAAAADALLLAVPSSSLLEVAARLPRERAVVNCAKGLTGGLGRLTEALHDHGFARVAVLSGPNHAEEVGRGLPAATVVASGDATLAESLQAVLAGPELRVYTSEDVAGVELGGALKNVVAVAAGMADGLQLGDNAKAALITRGLRELARFATARGAQPDTLYGLAGLGDLLATCWSRHSRNRAAGENLALGLPPETGGKVAEGIPTTARVVAWARREGVDLPLAEAVQSVLDGSATPLDALEALMARPAKPEDV